LANYEKVIDAVFKYIQRLKEVGPQEWVFQECHKVGNLAFKFLEKGQPINYAVSLARTMPLFKTSEDMTQVIRHKHLSDTYKPELLT
jgi:insulysin